MSIARSNLKEAGGKALVRRTGSGYEANARGRRQKSSKSGSCTELAGVYLTDISGRECALPGEFSGFNDLYCLARPQVHTLSVGAARPGDLDEQVTALAACDHAVAVVAPVEARLRAEMARVLGAEWCARWFEGVPEYLEVPGRINIREILRLWMHAKALDLTDWGKMRYNLLAQADHWFPGGNAARVREFDLGPASRGVLLPGRFLGFSRRHTRCFTALR